MTKEQAIRARQRSALFHRADRRIKAFACRHGGSMAPQRIKIDCFNAPLARLLHAVARINVAFARQTGCVTLQAQSLWQLHTSQRQTPA